MSPLAGVAALDTLCARNYRPIEVSSVLYRPVEPPTAEGSGHIRVRVIGSQEAPLWTQINAKGWAYDHPEFMDFCIITARKDTRLFLAEFV